jgi:hypothetical protein
MIGNREKLKPILQTCLLWFHIQGYVGIGIPSVEIVAYSWAAFPMIHPGCYLDSC